VNSWLKALFSEASGVSSMRIMGFISLILGGGIAIAGLVMKANLTELSILVGVFVGSAFGGKAVQKFAEHSHDQKLS
jgi:hypothetical protein